MSKRLLFLSFIFNCFLFNSVFTQNDSLLYRQYPQVLKTSTGDIFGTLTVPSGANGDLPVVLIIAGSGPTDRDCNNPMMKNDAYKRLAFALAANHIASLRYDKRGIAESKVSARSERELRFRDYVKDAVAWIEQLNADKRFSKVIVLGHSEGSLIGMLASQQQVSQFISLAGVAQPAAIILKEQLENMPDALRLQSFSIIDTLVRGREVAKTPPQLGSLFRPSVQPYLISWFAENPTVAIAALKIPILIVQGTADLQVKASEGRALANANPRSKLLMIDQMNHILRTISGGQEDNMASYNDPSLPLAAGLVTGLCDFINQK